MLFSIEKLLMLVPLFIVSISLHEASHAYVAHYFGDDTAKQQGRLTLNPLAHLDPIGTIVLIFAGFGWAKPVPVDVRNLKNPDWNMCGIAAAGPLSNLLLAVVSVIGWQLIGHVPALEPVQQPLAISTWINVMLFVFNLIPLHPLDGAGIFRAFLPTQAREIFDANAQYSMMILLVLIFLLPMLGVHVFSQFLLGAIEAVINGLSWAFQWL